MRVGLIGPGAIGCVVGGAIATKDDVELRIGARTGFDRLVVDGSRTPVDVAATTTTDVPEDDALDIVLLATKVHQTDDASSFLRAWTGPDTVVVILQNGVDHLARTAPLTTATRLVPVVVACPASRSGPGHAHLGGRAQLIVPDDEPGAVVVDLFADTYVEVTSTADWVTSAWLKLLTNCSLGAIGTLTRTTNEVFGNDPEGRAIALQSMREVATVGRSEGASIKDEDIEPFLDSVLRRASGHLSSIVVDRIAGNPTEWQARNQVVIDRARVHGVDVPVTAMLTALLRLGEPGT